MFSVHRNAYVPQAALAGVPAVLLCGSIASDRERSERPTPTRT